MIYKVLFVCTGNSARSQMAEALLRVRGGAVLGANNLFVFSAGLEPKGMNPFTVMAMTEIGISLEGQYSKSVREFLGKQHLTHMITVCADAEDKCPTVWPGLRNRLHWAFDDPAAAEGTDEDKLSRFREIRDQIDVKITAWVAELASQHEHAAN
jgi:arsenate reductase (thioredoxin)